MNHDNELVTCKYCKIESEWGGREDDPTMWSCEKCGEIFCDNCTHVDNENDKYVLCKSCRNSKSSEIIGELSYFIDHLDESLFNGIDDFNNEADWDFGTRSKVASSVYMARQATVLLRDVLKKELDKVVNYNG